MAKIGFILQAVTAHDHAAELKKLLSLPAPERILLSVAYVRETGVEEIEAALKPIASQTRFLVGIRNGTTSVQAIKRLLRLKGEVFAVDTGSRHVIFHPKMYLAKNAVSARVIVGSANMTLSGLHNNIEASTSMSLDLSDVADLKFIETAIAAFDELPTKHPEHVFRVKGEKHADKLFDDGRLVDETVVSAPKETGVIKTGKRDELPRMKLRYVARPRVSTAAAAKKPKSTGHGVKTPTPTPSAATPAGYRLVWESNELKERDLNIPKAKGTNPTGSMLFKKGALEGIDQRSFFRKEIFNDLTWTPDHKSPHLERSHATFRLIIKNLNYGRFDLRLTHNTRTKTVAYRQKNAMTQVHWGDIKEHVAKRDLLGRTLYLYRKDGVPPKFMIEID